MDDPSAQSHPRIRALAPPLASSACLPPATGATSGRRSSAPVPGGPLPMAVGWPTRWSGPRWCVSLKFLRDVFVWPPR